VYIWYGRCTVHSQHKGSTATSIMSPVVVDEKTRPDQLVGETWRSVLCVSLSVSTQLVG